MMYTVQEDEVAIVIKPIFDDNGQWTYELKTGISFGTKLGDHDDAGRAALNAAISMAACLPFIQDYPDFEDELMEYKESMLSEIFPDAYEAARKEIDEQDGYEADGNVIRLNRWSKTEGSA
jgi:hypothetical protein